MPVREISSDLFKTNADILVNTVNCVGVMGAGIAKEFKKKFPAMFADYKSECNKGKLAPGKLHIWKEELLGLVIVNFPTKRHWRMPSQIEDIELGLNALKKFLKDYPNSTVALPALGCGHGGLEYNQIKSLILKHLNGAKSEVLLLKPTAIRLPNPEKNLHSQQPVNFYYPLPELENINVFKPKNKDEKDVNSIALISSQFPSNCEIKAAKWIVNSLLDAKCQLVTCFSPSLDRKLAKYFISNERQATIVHPSGINKIKPTTDLHTIWDNSLLSVISAADLENSGKSKKAILLAKKLALAISSIAIVTDSDLDWLLDLTEKQGVHPNLFILNRDDTPYTNRLTLKKAGAKLISPSNNGRPDLSNLPL